MHTSEVLLQYAHLKARLLPLVCLRGVSSLLGRLVDPIGSLVDGRRSMRLLVGGFCGRPGARRGRLAAILGKAL